MDKELHIRIEELERQIAELPIGYISKKTIKGKIRYYHQWMEDKRIKSKYVKDGELEVLKTQIAKRKELQAQLKQLQKDYTHIAKTIIDIDGGNDKIERLQSYIRHIEAYMQHVEYETNVVVGDALISMSGSVAGWEKRDCYSQISKYLRCEYNDRVCIVYGLRRTGKTTLLKQAIGDISKREMSKVAYIKATVQDTMATLNRDIKKLAAVGYRYVFIDEVTLIKDFIDSAALFSDVYVAQGMKIVLSGTDSLGFWFANDQELYDRAELVHTTYIPYREHSKLLKIDSIEEYIRYGGTLRAGELDFEDKELNLSDASFRDDESTRRYIDTAICKNIQHSLVCYEGGGHFRHLFELYEKGELTGAINRIIEDMNHRFLVSVLTKDFVSGDLHMTARNLRKDRNQENRTDILDVIDEENVTKRLMNILDIRNKVEQSVRINEVHVEEIKEYLKALDLIIDCPLETAIQGAKPIERMLFVQPGMRYCQAQALVYSLMKDETFLMSSEYEKKLVCERILEEVRGRMMEDIVLLETSKSAHKYERVFKLQFASGEFDMVVYNEKDNACDIYEIKHSDKVVSQQYTHLMDEEKCALTERRFGKIKNRIVIYRGADVELDNGVRYVNVERYLKELGS